MIRPESVAEISLTIISTLMFRMTFEAKRIARSSIFLAMNQSPILIAVKLLVYNFHHLFASCTTTYTLSSTSAPILAFAAPIDVAREPVAFLGNNRAYLVLHHSQTISGLLFFY